MRIRENELLEIIKKSKAIALIEPPYKRKYIPLGLAKISAYAKSLGIQVYYDRQYNGEKVDAIFVTSLFTYDSQKVLDTIASARFITDVPIVVGGVYASLMPLHIEKTIPDVMIFRGYSRVLDQVVPDYEIDYGIDKKWQDFSFTFTTRGCPNNCAYCAVWRLEPQIWINPNWKNCIIPTKKYAMISDNNLSAQPDEHIRAVVDYLKEKDLRVVFDNGFDCKYITTDFAEMVSGLKFHRSGLRLAFDRIEEDGTFQDAIRKLRNSGVPKSALMAYVLFNFKDKPQDAYYRLKTCVELGIRPYPQMYTPLNKADRKDTYIGEYWTKELARAFRQYGLFAGIYTKMSFSEYMKTQELSQSDYAAWSA